MPRGTSGMFRFHAILPVLLPLSVFIFAGIAGVDYGRHWDEDEHLHNVRHSLITQTLLPTGGDTRDGDPRLTTGYYAYPGVIYWTLLISAAPEILHHLRDVTQPAVTDFIMSEAFHLRARAVFAIVSSLAILWTYLLVLKIRGTWLEALFAASLLAGSWEISYQSRWVATDTIVMQFGALCLLFCICGLDWPRWKTWARLAAIAAGFAAGTKYPGAILLLPVCLVAWIRAADSAGGTSRGVRWVIAAQLCLIGCVAFLVTTPGAVLQPWAFYDWLYYESHLYSAGTHHGYTVSGHLDHLWKIFVYESIVLFSHQPVIAGAVFVLAVVGAIAVCRQDLKLGTVLLIFPVVYVPYFMVQQLMIVRNLMVLSPFIAIFAARGMALAMEQISKPALKWTFVGAATAAVAFNLGFTVYAAMTIREAGASMNYDLAGLRDYINDHPKTRFDLSPQTADYLRQFDPDAAAHINLGETTREVVVVCSWEGNNLLQWPANQWDLAAETFGPYDVNFNYYPTWWRNRIVMIDFNRAMTLPVDGVREIVKARDRQK